ncbi:hypothetical protein SAMN05660359_01872 [Geodermatophilus obscurus]|uniref:Uncharacterized protein n=1 Tax=Geodermatophilus obscurus TaxID=1861 RepID=A0A1I5F4V3_9ACTN|nr:hypothetical protein [Geodermatophilus obscurus]SFO18754.1 hypothetical protein SAMN05660359_01872 [Geodermatophilus obscurus]
MPGQRSRSPLRRVAVHAAVVAGLLVLFAVARLSSGAADGADIGAGLVGLPLLALGFPWTLLLFVDPARLYDLPTALWYLVTLGPAVLNVALHALLVRRRPARG